MSQALFTQTISAITKFGIEVELHGDSSDNVGFDSFGIDQVCRSRATALRCSLPVRSVSTSNAAGLQKLS